MKNKQAKRQILALLLAVAILFSFAVPVVSAAGTAEISFGRVYGKRGEQVIVPVTIENNPGIASFRFRIAYDATALTYVSAAKGEAMTGGTLSAAYQAKDEELAVTWFDVKNITGDGVIFNLVFEISDTAHARYPLEVSCLPEDIVNASWQQVDITVIDGWVEAGVDYIVRFVDEDGTELAKQTYQYGDEVIAPTDPTKAADHIFSYTFSGWDKTVGKCTGNATYTATYAASYIDYTVVFKNWNGDVLSTKTYHYGDKIIVPEDPIKETDSYYIYTFIGWDEEIVNCAGDAIYQAVFAEEHYHTYNATLSAPSCLDQGYTTHTCHCGDTYVDTYIEALGHDEVAHTAKIATCTEIGWESYVTCSRCDYTTYEEIVATGHTEVIDVAVAPTCVKTGLTEGKHCSVCNKVLIAQIVVPSTGEHVWKEGNTDTDGYIHYTCTVCDKVAPLADTVAMAPIDSKVRLTCDVSVDLVISKNLVLDLNGFDITGNLTVTSGATLSVKDSQTDDYTIEDDFGCGKIIGKFSGIQAETGYMMIAEADGTSFHRIDLQITDMTLRSSDVGVYYKCNFAGDEMVAQQVDRYGVALSVAGEPNADAPGICSWYDSFTPGNGGNSANGTLLYGIMKTTNTESVNIQNAEMAIYGRTYILTKDGQYIFGECVNRSFREQVELVDDQWNELATQQRLAVLDMYRSYKVIISQWDIPNILEATQ